MKSLFSTLVVTRINGQRMCEEVPYSHRRAVKTVQKMINNDVFFQDGYSHRLISFNHHVENFTSFRVLIDNRDIAVILVRTIKAED